jgi:hypothetical protein
MKYLFSRAAPTGARILLIESGSRSLLERTVPAIRAAWAEGLQFDLVTCFGGLPACLSSDTDVFRVHDYGTPRRRNELISQLRSRDYAYIGMICSAEPIMTKWKWLIALRVPAKVFILNENGDYFWLNRENGSILWEFALVRAGLYGSDAPRTLARLVAFPFAVIYLLLYAFVAHARRAMRLRWKARLQH